MSLSLSIFLHREIWRNAKRRKAPKQITIWTIFSRSLSLSFFSSFIRWLSLICHTFNKCLCHSVLSADDDGDGNGSGSSDCDSSANAVRRLSMRHYYYYYDCYYGGMYPTGMGLLWTVARTIHRRKRYASIIHTCFIRLSIFSHRSCAPKLYSSHTEGEMERSTWYVSCGNQEDSAQHVRRNDGRATRIWIEMDALQITIIFG